MTATMPPRLTVLAARDADVAVVLRRGPTDWARLSSWDTATDVVTHGGWVHGRVSGRRVDLSPDGRLLVAFVAAHGRTTDHRRDTWVAISRPPWWHALSLWFDGSTWSYGGFFPDERSCALGGGAPDEGSVPAWFDAGAPLPHPRPGPAWTDVTVPHNRRVRDGWTQRSPGWWERPVVGGGRAITCETVDAQAAVTTEVALRWGEEIVQLGADATLDVDRAGRALVGRRGRLEVHVGPDRATDVRVVADLADQEPVATPAPAWARTWPAG